MAFLALIVLIISPKTVGAKHIANKKKKIITIALKKEIIKNHEREVCVVDLASQ